MDSKVTKKGTVRKRATCDRISKIVPLSTSLDNASITDKMLVQMKEEGRTWPEIREWWKAKTGEDTKNSTLPNRYARLRTNFMTLKEGDDSRLLAAHAEISEDIEAAIARSKARKWARVMEAMKDKGSREKYPSPFLQKKYEELVSDLENEVAKADRKAKRARQQERTRNEIEANQPKDQEDSRRESEGQLEGIEYHY